MSTDLNQNGGTPPEQEANPDLEAVEADPADTGPSPGAETEAAAADDETARLREAMLRLRADIDNREKRMEREMAKVRKFAIEALLRDLVPVLDTMDQAIAAGDSGADGGMELTRRMALKVLCNHGLEVLDPVGEPFDPSWHEAMSTAPSGDQPVDTVVQVLQKGYRLNDRLVRPARVIVAR